MKKGKFNAILLTALFVTGILISGYFLLQLKSDLSVTSGVLAMAEIETAKPFLIRLQVVVFGTFIIGLVGFFLLQRNHDRELIYVERKSKENVSKENDEQHSDDSSASDLSYLQKALKAAKEKAPEKGFSAICNQFNAVAGVLYQVNKDAIEMIAPYALTFGESQRTEFEIGEGFVGQAAKEKKTLIIDNIPENSIRAISGLGEAPPKSLIFLPVLKNDKVLGVIELGTFQVLSKTEQKALEEAGSHLMDFITPKMATKEKAPKS